MAGTTVKRRRTRRAPKNPLHGVVTEARKMRREINRYLSEAFSHAIGFECEVRMKNDPPASPEMKRATKKGSRAYSKELFATFNRPVFADETGYRSTGGTTFGPAPEAMTQEVKDLLKRFGG